LNLEFFIRTETVNAADALSCGNGEASFVMRTGPKRCMTNGARKFCAEWSCHEEKPFPKIQDLTLGFHSLLIHFND
jgi:hypothetical protein